MPDNSTPSPIILAMIINFTNSNAGLVDENKLNNNSIYY